MSFDPLNDPPLYGTDSGDPHPGLSSMAGQRLTLPGIFLIVIGVLNILASIAPFSVAFFGMRFSPEEFEKVLRSDPNQQDNLRKMKEHNLTFQDLLDIYVKGGIGYGVVILIASFLIIVAGICMLRRKARSLAILGAITAALPCISPSSCPFLIGLAVGIWALVVLVNQEVKAAFR